jgi:hypothetical protein
MIAMLENGGLDVPDEYLMFSSKSRTPEEFLTFLSGSDERTWRSLT